MDNNITNLYKLINFTNKKTTLNELDNYVIIENGSFILQDAFKTCVYSFDFLKDIDNCFIKKEDLVKTITKNAKYYVEDINNEQMIIKAETKNGETLFTVPFTKGTLDLSSIINNEFKCNNLIKTNGISLKAMLKDQSSNLTFKFKDDSLLVSLYDDNEEEKDSSSTKEFDDNNFMNFNDEFGVLCTMDVESSDDSIAQISGQTIADTITQFRLVKKNSDLSIQFNNICFALSNLNLTIYLLSNKI